MCGFIGVLKDFLMGGCERDWFGIFKQRRQAAKVKALRQGWAGRAQLAEFLTVNDANANGFLVGGWTWNVFS
jgi:hypothetical protein